MANYVAVCAGTDSRLTIVDISTPTVLAVVGSVAITLPSKGCVIGDHVFVIGNDSLYSIDVSTPATPVLDDTISGAGSPNYLDGAIWVAGSGNYVYVVSVDDNAISIFDVSDPTSLSLVASVQGTGSPNYLNDAWSCALSGNYLYVVAFADYRLTIWDISTPASPTIVSNFGGTATTGTADATEANKLHDADGEFGTGYVGGVALNSTASPVVASKITGIVDSGELILEDDIFTDGDDYLIWDNKGGYYVYLPSTVTVKGDYAYLLTENSATDETRLVIVNIANKSYPHVAGQISQTTGASPYWFNSPRNLIVDDDGYCYVTSKDSDALSIFDVRNPYNPTFEGVIYDGDGATKLDTPWSIAKLGDYIYVASSTSDSLTAIDVSTKTAPSEADTISGFGSPTYLNGARGAMLFSAGVSLPTVQTDAASLIKQTTARLNGTLTSDGGAASADMYCGFDYGRTSEYGSYSGTASGYQTNDTFYADLTGLLPNTLYHFRAKAINPAGTAYGADATFTTKSLIEDDGGEPTDMVKAQGFVSSIRRHFRKDAANSQGGVYTIEVGLGGFGSGITSFTSPDRTDPTAIPGPDFYKTRLADVYSQLGAMLYGAGPTREQLEQAVRVYTELPSMLPGINVPLPSPGGEEMSPTIRDLHKYYPRFPTALWDTLGKRLSRLENMSPGVPATTDEAVLKTLFDAQTILAATTDDIPAALTLTEQTLAGRLTGGNVAAIALGIADNNVVQVDGSPNDDEYARWTAAGLEGKTIAELLSDLGLSGVTPPLSQGFKLTTTDMYVDDTAIGLRNVWLISGYHIEYDNGTGETRYTAN